MFKKTAGGREGVMGEFEIDLVKVAGWADKIDGYSAEIKRQKGQIESILGQLAFRGDYRDVKRALSGIAANMDAQHKQMKQCGGMLGNIVKAYKGTETAIVTSGTPAMKVEAAVNGAVKEGTGLALKLLGKFGITGSLASTIAKFIQGSSDGIDERDILKLLKGADGIAGKMFGALGESGLDLKKLLFGITSKKEWDKLKILPGDHAITKWKKYFADQMGDYGIQIGQDAGESVADASKGAKVAAKYIGAALDFAITAMNNKEEFGGVMTGRAWGETIAETAVSAAEGFAIGGMVALAMGPGAGVLAVGVATAAATWAFELGYKALTGSENGFLEDASDLICDSVERAGKAVGNWAKSTWGAVSDFFSGGKGKAAYSGAW